MIQLLADAATIAIGDVLDDKYEITDILGEGAMGVVYLALHRRLGRMVALKTLRAEIAGDRELVERFEREARAASAIGHPNIVQVFDAGGPPGSPYLVMENLSGSSLGELLGREGPMEVGRAITLCRQVLAGLGAAHGAGIVHRDLKPDNIFVCLDAEGQEEVKILDFGISKILAVADPAIVGDGSSTRAGMVMGTPLYMSPEQASGREDLDHRTDLWSLVCVLYECVSGATPFKGENYNQILSAVLRGEHVPLAKCAPSVSASLSALVDRGLALDRGSRFADAASLYKALGEVSTASPSSAEQDEMLAAFDNLADRFLEQEAAPAPARRSATAPAGGPQQLDTPRGDARFAPPSADGPVSLALDLETPTRAPVREKSIELQAPRRKRSSSQFITRDVPKSRVGTFVKLLLLLVVVAAGGLGYRYYTLGYIVPPTAVSMASLELVVRPPGAQVELDGVVKGETRLSLVADESFELGLRADNRLARKQRFDTKAGMALVAKVRLANQLPSIEDRELRGFAELEPLDPHSGEDLVDAGAEKLRAYARCATPLRKAIGEAESKGADAEPMARALVDECVLALRVTAEATPPMSLLDDASLSLAAAITDFDKAARELKNSAGAASKLMRSRRSAVVKTSKELSAAETTWAGAESSTQAQWLALELVAVFKREPDGMHARLREVAVNSDRWMRARLAKQDTGTLRAAMIGSYENAEEAAALDPATYKASGGEAFMTAIKTLTSSEPAEDPLFWHNQAIDTFNQMVLPIDIKSTVSESQARR